MDPCDLPALTARRLIGAKKLSPLELLESCLARIRAVNPAINAMVALDEAGARAAAAAAERRVMRGEPLRLLEGLPLGVKDLEETAGLRTTFGSLLFADHVPAEDEANVARLRAAGAIVLGKTNTPEFGAGANTWNAVYGATGNPFDPEKSAAGSSGGSAAALATGMVPLATGSDLGGSLRNPAAFCGVVGFRPSPGLVPAPRRPLGWSGLAVLGPMARTVGDLALLLAAQAADDPRDPLAAWVPGRTLRHGGEFHPLAPRDLSALRVAMSEDFGIAPVEAHIRRVFRRRMERLAPLFAACTPAHPDCSGADEAFAVLRAVSFLAAHEEKLAAPHRLGPNVRANLEEGLGYTARDAARAGRLQTELYRRFQTFFGQYDLLLTPAITVSPRPWRELYPREIDGVPTRTYYHWLALAYPASLAGHPALVLPLGRDEAGMPFGLQIIGPRGGDALVLGAGLALEAIAAADPELARPEPDLVRLMSAPPIAAAPGFKSPG
jgi:amidase